MEDSVEGAMALHEQLVSYAHAVLGDPEARTGVCVEHSYARGASGGGGAGAAHVLAPRRSSARLAGPIDVDTAPPPPPSLPLDCERIEPGDADESGDESDDWQTQVTGLAPTAVQARLSGAVLEALRAVRLAQLAGGSGRWARREAAAEGARRVRRALARATAAGGGPAPASWLPTALAAHAPRCMRALWRELAAELTRMAPRLAERLGATYAPSPPDPLSLIGSACQTGSPRGEGPWLVWVSSGAGGGVEARFERRVRALAATRVLQARAPSAAPPPAAAAAALASARASLTDLLTELGDRPVALCGAGAGAALCAALCAGAGGAGGSVRALVLLAPPLRTAEGERAPPDDPLNQVSVPTLVVAGCAGARASRGPACGVANSSRRVLALPADDALRLGGRARRALRLPQHALDAAIAEECVRWAGETLDAPARTPRNDRSIEIVEGRVVARVCGGVPLGLGAPRRSPSRAPLDIMRLPVVFADDEPPRAPAETGAADGGVKVTSGLPRAVGAGVRVSRVIVAKRATR